MCRQGLTSGFPWRYSVAMTTTECPGDLTHRLIDMEGELIYIVGCTRCTDRKIIVGSKMYPSEGGAYPADATDEQMVRMALMERALNVPAPPRQERGDRDAQGKRLGVTPPDRLTAPARRASMVTL